MRLFEPINISGMRLKNKIVHTPIVTNLATKEGYVTRDLIERYARIARGGAAWIIIEDVVVTPRMSPYNLIINDDRFIEGLKRLTETVHRQGDVKIGIQLGHFLKVSMSGYRQTVENLTRAEIIEIYDQHIEAAKRIKLCGFDSLEWDAESCMTLSQFLSRNNKRKDDYGGKLENRMRLLLEIYDTTREILGRNYILGARINGDDLVIGGNTLLHSTQIALKLAEKGIDYLSISCGGQWEDARPVIEGEPPSAYTGYSGLRCWPRTWEPDGTNVYMAEAILKHLRKVGYSTPIITAGKIPTPEFAEEILNEEKADIIGLGRPLLCDPDWVNKAINGKTDEIIYCKYCNHCAEVNDRFELTNCIQWPKGNIQAPDPFLPKEKD